MKEEKDHIIYTAKDIKRYFAGEMLPAERHAIEMAALDDPLLAEAMEGYELMEQNDWSNELAALQKKLNEEKKEATPVITLTQNQTIKWWKAAAAVLVLGTAATTAYFFNGSRENKASQQIAKTENIAIDSASITLKTDSGTFATQVFADSANSFNANANTITPNGTVTFAHTPSTTNAYNELTANTDSNFIYRPSQSGNSGELIAMKDDKAADYYKAENTTEKEFKTINGNSNIALNPGTENNGIVSNNSNFNNEERNFNNAATEPNVVTLDKKAQEANNANATFLNVQNKFSGQVVTADNKPVGFASIKLQKNNKPLFTDAKGFFDFKASDSTLNVTVTSAGYTAQPFVLKNSVSQNKIILEPQQVATQNFGKAKSAAAKRRQQVFTDSTLLSEDDAEPAGGWIEYNNYLSSNIRFPEDARQKNIHGEVEITVKLNSNGDVSQVKVDKPLSPECDAEAIRLVKEGPKWDVKNTKKKKIKIKVKF
jgi:TonB family protein